MIANLSLRARLTIWYSVVLVVALAIFAAGVLVVQRRLGVGRLDGELDSMHDTIVNILHNELEEGETQEAAAIEARDTVVGGGTAIAVFDDRGRALAERVADGDRQVLVNASDSSGTATVRRSAAGWRVRAERNAFPVKTGTITLTTVIAAPLDSLAREQRSLVEAILVGAPLALLLAGGGGLWLSSIGLRPIQAMSRQADAIDATGLETLGDPVRRDELGVLARAFNDLLGRLRASLRAQQQFMADASHELRTPACVIGTAAQVALSREHRDEADYRETLGIVNDQATRLARLIEDMLVLARVDAGGYALAPVDVYLDDVVDECCRAASILARERAVAIRVDAPGEVAIRGDEMLLHRLVLNIVQNAVQHTPAGGTVSVSVARETGGARVRVLDGGSGIQPEDRSRIFDRFVQLDPSRRGKGSGLGLPIARWIAEAHHGEVALESSGPTGSCFTIWLPA